MIKKLKVIQEDKEKIDILSKMIYNVEERLRGLEERIEPLKWNGAAMTISKCDQCKNSVVDNASVHICNKVYCHGCLLEGLDLVRSFL